MDTPIAMILVFDWTTESDVICVMEVMVVLRDVGEEFDIAKSDIIVIVGSNLIEFKLSYYTANG